MVEKRYQVYIASSYNDVVNERLKVEYSLLSSGFFPWEFSERRTSLNTSKARQQIDESDYVIFIISGRYGDLSASGISYLHLDYLYASNKNKTIITLIDAHPERKNNEDQESDDELIKKLNAFKALLKKESEYSYEYTNILDLERATKTLLAKAVSQRPALGWVRPQPQLATNTNAQAEIERLRSKVIELEKKLLALSSVAPKKYTIDSDIMQAHVCNEDDTVQVSYRAHAYQDGNLQDIHPKREMSWMEILKVLAPHFKRPSLESSFIRAMNEYLETTALDDARKFLPRAHAVARTQIDSRSMQQIKLQMKWNNWIVPQQENAASTRIYWALTQEGQKQLTSLVK